MNKIRFLFIVLTLRTVSLFAQNAPATEVRAVWLTTNYGLDWPINKISVEVQKRELITILDNLQRYNFNTVMFQVRAKGEVYYQSKIEPMASVIASSWGQPTFDPLTFVIEECHKRGLECHAWLVTYPLGRNRHVQSLGARSVVKTIPSITKQFKGEWFLDPGNPQTDDYLLSLIKEIVTNYDIDGIHFDYIRYPDNKGQFPDAPTYRMYGKGKSLQDWRRDNITRFVTKTYDWIKSRKKWIQVSSSPLGRYRALGMVGAGWTAYESVYQDAGKWMKTGKHDALYPMMYYKEHLFYPFVDDWILNGNDRIVVPGLGAYQMIELGWSRQDITNQIDYTRRKAVSGQAFFRTENVISNTKGILNSLKEYYKYPAKLPPMTWLSSAKPEAPYDLRAEKMPNGIFRLSWSLKNKKSRLTYNIYRTETDNFDINNAQNLLAVSIQDSVFEYTDFEKDKAYYYFVTVSDAYHNESVICTPAFFFHSDIIK